MTIIELLQKVGVENVLVQNIENSMDAADYTKKRGGTVIKLFTDQVQVDDLMAGKFKKIGLVVWFDKSLWPTE